ncbi:hypothetical protein [Solimonas sp. SE-A11]|uniref:hypothetical protein n=1 Tax=Solimonas sp. SE-A11 TaxID=3054954 RepID=UPI00345FBC22
MRRPGRAAREEPWQGRGQPGGARLHRDLHHRRRRQGGVHPHLLQSAGRTAAGSLLLAAEDKLRLLLPSPLAGEGLGERGLQGGNAPHRSLKVPPLPQMEGTCLMVRPHGKTPPCAP